MNETTTVTEKPFKSNQNSTINHVQMKYTPLQMIITNYDLVTPLKIKSMPSSEEIQENIQSCKNIRNNINSDISDLFKKINQLSNSIQLNIKTNIGNNIKNKIIDSTECIKSKLSIQSHSIHNIIQKNQDNQTNGSQTQLNIFSPIQIWYEKGIKVRDFQIGKTLGFGKFGQTLLSKHRQTGIICAIKKLFKSTIKKYDMEKQVLIQIEALKRLNHPNIIKGYTAFTDQFHVFIVMQYALGVSLVQKMGISEKETSKIIKQVLAAIQHMHQHCIVHRDIKLENIIIDQQGSIKICDFGWGSLEVKNLNIICGTLDYVSPQMVKSSFYSKEVDLWCVGVLTYQLLFGVSPFQSKDKKILQQKVINLQFEYPKNQQVSDTAKKFIQGFLRYEKDRKPLKWGLEHQFIKAYEEKNEEKNEDKIQLYLI